VPEWLTVEPVAFYPLPTSTRGKHMAPETSERVMREYLEALLARGDFGRFFTDDVLWTTMESGEQIRGRDAVRDYIVALHTVVFDARPVVRGVAVSGDVALLEADFVGRHIGDMGGIAATGREVKIPYCVVYDIRGEQIAALRAYFPVGALMQQVAGTAAVPA
jgi:ketosteroid isomerase-like protein